MATITMYNDINVDDAFSPMFVAVSNNTSAAAYTSDVIATAWVQVATIGDIVTNGTFTGGSTGWTLGGGGGTPDWYYSANAIFHANGSTNQLVPNPALTIVPGNTYEVTFTTTRSAGGVTVSLGGATGTLRSTAGTFTETLTATTTANLAFTPQTTFVGSVDTVIVRLQNWNSVCYGNKQIVAVARGSRTIATSYNGSTWMNRIDALPSTENWQSITFGSGTFVAVANGTTPTATSIDGITWASGGAMPAASAWFCVAYGNPGSTANGIFVAVPSGAGVAAVSTDKGVNWSSAGNTLPNTGDWRTVTYGNGVFVAFSYNSNLAATSTDGVTWTSRTLDNTRNWSSVTYGNPFGTTNGIFLAVVADSSLGAVSTDKGATWTEISISPNLVFNGTVTEYNEGWTLGAGWTYDNGKLTHASGSGTNTVVPVPAITIATTTKYEITYTVSGSSGAGTITVAVGGVSGTARSTDGTYTEVITTAGATTNLTFTPQTLFDGSIDNISLRLNGTWNCVSYGEIAGQGRKVFTVTGRGTSNTLISFDGLNWFLKTIISAAAWSYHCFAPITWNSGDTLSVQNNATITVNTSQTKFWKTFTATYGKLSIQNIGSSNPISYYMGRVTSNTANDITPASGAFSIDIDGDWIEIGTGDGTASQSMTASYTEYIPSLWVETGSGTGVYEIWNNISGATGPYMKLFGRTGLEWVGTGKFGNYFVQSPATNPIAIISVTSATTTIQSYFITCTSTAGIFPGATISDGTATYIPATSVVVNRVVNSTTLEINVPATTSGSSLTFTVYNPAQSQFSSTINFGDGVSGNVVPDGAKVRQPNIMFSDATAANLITASHLVGAYINLSTGAGNIDARVCLFGEAYLNMTQASSVYFRNVGFAYQWALSECYAANMDYIGNAAGPTIWYYSGKWIIRDPRYGILAPTGYTSSTATQNVSLSYIHNAIIKNWHKVYYCTAYFTGTSISMPIDLSYSDDTVWENIRSVALNSTRIIRAFNISNRVYRGTFTNLELYGCAPFGINTSDNNTFSNIEYAPDLTLPIQSFKTGMRLSQDASGTLLTDNVPVYIKTRTFFSWMDRANSYFESGEYSATPFQNNWLFPDTLSIRPTETVPASVTIDWTRREPTAATTTAYEIHRSTTEAFTTRDQTTAVFRIATPATITFANGPRTPFTATGGNTLTFNANKTIARQSINWATDGFAVGDVVEVTGTTGNNGVYTINTISTVTLTVNETLVTEGAYSANATVTGRPPTLGTQYFYRMRKFHSITVKATVQGTSGSTTLTTTGTGGNSFDVLYAATDFYFDSGTKIIRNRKYNLFATPFYLGCTITGTGIPVGTTITYIDAAGQKFNISNNTTQAGTNVTIYLPVQAGMAVLLAFSRPAAGLPYGSTVVSVENNQSLTISNALTADLCPTVVNGTFTGGTTGWTLNSGWSYGSNNVTHSGAGTGVLTPSTPLTAVIGATYNVLFTVSNWTAGTVQAQFGGAVGTARGANGIWTETITATSTATLNFIPASSFSGTIDDISIGVPVSFLPYTESPVLVATPHDYTSATNLCLQSRTLATAPWSASNITATNANVYAAPSEITWSTTATATSLVSTNNNGTVTQSITGLTAGLYYSASIWVRAEQTVALPNGVDGSLTWAGTSQNFTATYDWKQIKVQNVQASGTSHDIVVKINTTGQTIWATDAYVNLGATCDTGNIVNTTTATPLKPCALPITTLYSYARCSDMVGSTGHQGIQVTFGGAIAGAYYHEVYLSTTSGFIPSDSNLVARTWALSDSTPFAITSSNYNNFSNITKLPYGGGSTSATLGVFYLTANSNSNAIVNCDIDYTYCNTTAIPAFHLLAPAQNNVFHNINFGRVCNYLAASTLWYASTTIAPNSDTGNRVQNIYAKHYDYMFNDQTLNSKFKGIASGNSWPAIAATTYTFGSGIDDLTLTKTACYGSMFNELYFSDTKGAIVIIMEDTQGDNKPYTTTGSPRFSNTGRLYMPTVNDSITITWPWKIKGVTNFRDVMPRLSGLDYGNNNIFLDSLKLEYKLNNGDWNLLNANNLVAEGDLDATNGFDFAVRVTPQPFMKFSTQNTATYTSHTVASPGVITISGTITWAVGQEVLYTTTGTPFGGLTNDTLYYIVAPNTSPTTAFQLASSRANALAGTALTLDATLGTGVHTFNVLFKVGDTIAGATSFATAVISEVYYDTITTGTLVFSSVSGSWVAGEVIRTPDFKAIKARNVATNFFAMGPQYTSYISALQIGTWIDQGKQYDAAIVTVTLQNIVPGSIYYIYNTDTSEQIVTGTAQGTLAEGETTLNYDVGVVYEEDFNITVNVRKSTAPVKYLPYSTGGTVTSAGASVFIAQIIDSVVIDSYGAISADWDINTTYKTIKHKVAGTTIWPINSLYSWLLDYFDNEGYLDDEIPISASTPVEYKLIHGWFMDDFSTQFLSGGSLTTEGFNNEIYVLTMSETPTNPINDDLTKLVTNGGGTHTGRLLAFTTTAPYKWYIRKALGVFTAEDVTVVSGTGAGTISTVITGETVWSNIFSLGSLVAGTVLDVYQNDTKISPWWTSGGVHLDILVRVRDAGVEIDSGNLTVMARKYGTLYDHFVIDASTGRNPVPLAAFVDGNNSATNEATVAGYVTYIPDENFDFGYASKNMGEGPKPYDVVIDCGSRTILQVYEYLKYVTRTGSTTTLNGVLGEYYTGVGDVQFAFDNESGSFVEGQLINGSAGVYGYLTSIKVNPSGYMTLRNVHGTFTNNMSLTQTPSGATAQVDGSVSSITPQKQAPFGSYAGGTFFGARGVWLENVATIDANNYQLIDALGDSQIPPPSVLISVSGLVEGDKVAVFRTVGNTEILDKTMYYSDASANQITDTTFVVGTTIESDTPSAGKIRVVDRDTAGKILGETTYAYTSWTGSTFTLSEALTATYNEYDSVYVPYIDTTCPALTDTVSVSVSFNINHYVVTRVRHKGIVPFTVTGELKNTGLPVTAIRTEDTIVS